MRIILIYTAVSVLMIGLGQFLFRVAMPKLNDPFVGAVIRLFFSFATCALILGAKGDWYRLSQADPRGAVIMGVTGILMGVATICLMNAFRLGEVKIVTPVLSLNPIITIILAVIFLKEQWTFRQVLGAILLFPGLLLILK